MYAYISDLFTESNSSNKYEIIARPYILFLPWVLEKVGWRLYRALLGSCCFFICLSRVIPSQNRTLAKKNIERGVCSEHLLC